ncbi:uncharacterized protein LOC129595514 [Paramacrobiotus metropolitanus]|uniref:uncharacterized protein LOC129595514 n=1 Tax=Paramacrobiotus metropolitanus TaxID=2943436 RepID=UPI002445E5B5|nr:uncharacterized protein LOC129595514 [Paramacrobiotus metropolitanus]
MATMNDRTELLLIFLFGCISWAPYTSAQRYSSYPDLEETCNQSLEMECPNNSNGRAGTFRYYDIGALSRGLCSFTVTLDSDCGGWSDNFAFYFNIREITLPRGDYLKIYENRNGSRSLLQRLTGDLTQSYYPSSVAQALTSYSKQPSFTLEYFRSASRSSDLDQTFIDFVITEDSPHYRSNSWCEALQGYVSNDFICDKGGLDDRVNCPSNFEASVNGGNPANWRQCDIRTPAPSPPVPTVPSRDSNGLSPGASTGIIVGIFLPICFIIALCIAVSYSARRRALLNQPTGQTPTGSATTRPLGVGRREAPAPDLPFMGAPPSYAEVTATSPHVTLTMPAPISPPPKYSGHLFI